jgi:hypothetical protein
MEKYFGDIIAGLVILLIGSAVVAIVKSSLNGFILQLEERFVTIKDCGKQIQNDAKEREFIRIDIQDHEERLNHIRA